MIWLYNSFLLRALVASGGLVCVLEFGGGLPSWVRLVLLMILLGVLSYQLWALGQRLQAAEGKQTELGLLRVAVLISAALLMTVWLDEQDRGTWREWTGWLLSVCAVVGTADLFRREHAAMRECGEA